MTEFIKDNNSKNKDVYISNVNLDETYNNIKSPMVKKDNLNKTELLNANPYINNNSIVKEKLDIKKEDTIQIEAQKEGVLLKEYIGTINDVKEYQVLDIHIIKGYRIHYVTFNRVLKSLFIIHNETFNIWSHLLGFVIAFVLLIITMSTLSVYQLLYKDEVINKIKGNYENNLFLSKLIESNSYDYNNNQNGHIKNNYLNKNNLNNHFFSYSRYFDNINTDNFNNKNANICLDNNDSIEKIYKKNKEYSNLELFDSSLYKSFKVESIDNNYHEILPEDVLYLQLYNNQELNKKYLKDLKTLTKEINKYSNKDILCVTCLKQRYNILKKIQYYKVKNFNQKKLIEYNIKKNFKDFNKINNKTYDKIYDYDNCKKNDYTKPSNFTCLANFLFSKEADFLSDQYTKNKELLDFCILDNNEKYSRKLAKWPLAIFFISGMICLGFSTLFHLFMCHNLVVRKVLNRLDYAGIAILIVGSCYPPYYYYFYCHIVYAIAYLSFMSIFGLIIFGISLSNKFDRPKYTKLKGILFLMLGISAGAAIVHINFFQDSIDTFKVKPNLLTWYFGGASYIIGAIIYICRVPERFKHGVFDYVGSSHNIFHIFVLIGFGLHYEGVMRSYNFRLENSCSKNWNI